MSRLLIARDDWSGICTYHNYDPDTDTSVFEYEADSEPVLEFNKKIINEADISRQGIKQGWWWYAQIPAALQLKWYIEEGIKTWAKEHAHRVYKKVNDPEYCHLKMTYGKHTVSAHD